MSPNTRSRLRESCSTNDNKKTTPTNFLSGYKLNTIDIHSLPDPPSPASSKNKKIRRRSSPVVISTTTIQKKSSPFHDCTNKMPRSRKSLSLIPSPDFLSSDCSTESSINNPSNKVARSKRDRKSLPSPECLSLIDTSSEVITRKSKRSKKSNIKEVSNDDDDTEKVRNDIKDLFDDNNDDDKRKLHQHSSSLPPRSKPPFRNARLQQNKNTINSQKASIISSQNDISQKKKESQAVIKYDLQSTDNNLQKVKEVVSTSNNTLVAKNSNNEIDTIKQYIRQLCTATNNNNTNKAKELADDIHKMTGYKPYVAQKQTNQASNNDALRELYKRYVPIIDKMELHRKESETKLQSLTGCIVEKKRNGKFCYRDITTNKLIDVNAYKDLYMDAICKHNDNDSVKDNDKSNCKRLMGSDKALNCTISNEEQQISSLISTSSSAISSSSSHLYHKAPESLCNIINYKEVAKTTIIANEEEDMSIVVSNNKNSNDNILMTLPNRYQTSSTDPDIIAAERKLWCSIDTALATYSAEVMAIKERKKKNSCKK